jgi:hypothetical protein
LSCKGSKKLYKNECINDCSLIVDVKVYAAANSCEVCPTTCETCNNLGCLTCLKGTYLF